MRVGLIVLCDTQLLWFGLGYYHEFFAFWYTLGCPITILYGSRQMGICRFLFLLNYKNATIKTKSLCKLQNIYARHLT